MNDPGDRRSRYPFINCTQCGPRYTLIERLPYDRANTSMAGFPLCSQCAAEYADMNNRRFHAEPVGCAKCGPRLEFQISGKPVQVGADPLEATISALRSGQIVAVKGIGGYHLLCDAANCAAVALLRARKSRPDKPLGVMFPLEPGLIALRRAVILDPTHEMILRDPIRPLVLVPKSNICNLAPEIAPGCGEIGAMLPYSPLHCLLLAEFGGPLVVTSGNISGEPVMTDNDMAAKRLAGIADAFLHHNRPILRPADDPVYRVIAGKPRPIRLGRGNAPLEIELPFTLAKPLLALGGHLKGTLTLAWDNRAVVSPHLGDMSTNRGLNLLKRVAADLQSLYSISAQEVICDAHPSYATTKLAPLFGSPGGQNISSRSPCFGVGRGILLRRRLARFCLGRCRIRPRWNDLGRRGTARRPGQLAAGGNLAVFRTARRRADRCATLGVVLSRSVGKTGKNWNESGRETELLRHAWTRGLNCPSTSSVGRLFDGAAALLGLVDAGKLRRSSAEPSRSYLHR